MIDLEGMYDLHIHPAPSLQKRKFSALEAVKLASLKKMAGVLFLDHTYNTTTMVKEVAAKYPERPGLQSWPRSY